MASARKESARTIIQQVNAKARPRTVRELLALVVETNPRYQRGEVLTEIVTLVQERKLLLSPKRFEGFQNFWIDFHWNVDFWIVALFSLLAFMSILVTIPYPWSLLRLILIVPFFFYLPGRSLFAIVTPGAESTLLEKALIEFASSIVLVLLVGLILNYSSLGFFAEPSIYAITLLNIVLGFVASYRHYSNLQGIR